MEAALARAYSGMARGAGSWRIDGRGGGWRLATTFA
jgi:hypothetical protein